MKMTFDLTLHFTEDVDTGLFAVKCLEIPEAISQGKTREEAAGNIRDAIKELFKANRDKHE